MGHDQISYMCGRRARQRSDSIFFVLDCADLHNSSAEAACLGEERSQPKMSRTSLGTPVCPWYSRLANCVLRWGKEIRPDILVLSCKLPPFSLPAPLSRPQAPRPTTSWTASLAATSSDLRQARHGDPVSPRDHSTRRHEPINLAGRGERSSCQPACT